MAEEEDIGSGGALNADDNDQEVVDAALNTDDDDQEVVGAVYGISVDVTAVLGTTIMPISQILKLGRSAVVELERLVGEEIELVAEENIIAKGEVVVIDDRLAVSITQIVKRH